MRNLDGGVSRDLADIVDDDDVACSFWSSRPDRAGVNWNTGDICSGRPRVYQRFDQAKN